MSSEHEITRTLDVKGKNCPMPVVEAKQATDGLEPGDVLEVLATDAGSMSDVDGWAASTAAIELLEQSEVDDGGETVYRHLVRKVEA
jgi:tRNA 2-thiouridine synthesizing protein A